MILVMVRPKNMVGRKRNAIANRSGRRAILPLHLTFRWFVEGWCFAAIAPWLVATVLLTHSLEALAQPGSGCNLGGIMGEESADPKFGKCDRNHILNKLMKYSEDLIETAQFVWQNHPALFQGLDGAIQKAEEALTTAKQTKEVAGGSSLTLTALKDAVNALFAKSQKIVSVLTVPLSPGAGEGIQTIVCLAKHELERSRVWRDRFRVCPEPAPPAPPQPASP